MLTSSVKQALQGEGRSYSETAVEYRKAVYFVLRTADFPPGG